MRARQLVAGFATVAISIWLWALAQGLGESIGHGMHEWLVR